MRPLAAIKPSCLKWSFSFVKFLLSCDFCCHRVAWSWLRSVSSNPDNSELSIKHMCSTMTFFLRIAEQIELWSHVDICMRSPIHYPLSNIDAWSINLTSVGSELAEQSRAVIYDFAIFINSFAGKFLKVEKYCWVRKPVRQWPYRTNRLRRPCNCIGHWVVLTPYPRCVQA